MGLHADPERARAAVAARCPGRPVEVRETHISWVFLSSERAFKLKKPVVLEFLDYGTPARRRAMCHEEVRLNARLAPALYLGVLGLAPTDGELRIVDESDPDAIDYLVEMRRYDEAQTLAALARAGEPDAALIAALGDVLAAFHADAPRRDGSGARAVRRELCANLEDLYAHTVEASSQRRIAALARFLHSFLTGRSDELDARADRGRRREGHGDLRAEHVIVGPRPLVVDCVEFDPELRCLDTADDIAFLVMDLCRLGREASARRLLDAYRRAGGDPGDDPLVWFFAVHRALVRAKVALIRGTRPGAGSDPVQELLVTAERCAWRARAVRSVAVCGVPASGKSHLAARLAAYSGSPVLASDRLRKELAGVPAHAPAPPGGYEPDVSRHVYRELGRRARLAADRGGGILLDATFRCRRDRDAFAAGYGEAARMLFIQCIAPSPILFARARERAATGDGVSDAGEAVVAAESGRFEPLDEVTAADHLVLRTDRPVDEVVGDVLAALDARLLGPTPAAQRPVRVNGAEPAPASTRLR